MAKKEEKTGSEASQSQHAPSTHTAVSENTTTTPLECFFTSYEFLTPAGSRLYELISSGSRDSDAPVGHDATTTTAGFTGEHTHQIKRCIRSSQPSFYSPLLALPLELRDMVLGLAFPDVTFCVEETIPE